MRGCAWEERNRCSRERESNDSLRVPQIFDKHERGYICASDLRAVLQCLGEDLSLSAVGELGVDVFKELRAVTQTRLGYGVRLGLGVRLF